MRMRKIQKTIFNRVLSVDRIYEIIHAVESVLNELTDTAPPFDLLNFAKKKKWKVIYDELHGPDGYMAKFNIKGRDRFAIYIATDKDTYKYTRIQISRRQYFTLAHEIGHILLHGKSLLNSNHKQNVDTITAAIMEYEAHTFASLLLMPDYIFTNIDDLSAHLLAEKCDVNVSAAHNRLKILDESIKNKIINDNQSPNNIIIFPNPTLVPDFSVFDQIASAAEILKVDGRGFFIQSTEVNMSDKYYYYPSDDNGRYYSCVACGNHLFSDSATHCKMCGTYLFNYCIDENCGRSNTSDARHCEYCGGITDLHKRELLYTCQELENVEEGIKSTTPQKITDERKPINISDDDLPF